MGKVQGAKACGRRISGRSLSLEESKAAAAVIHYAIAGSMGVFYAMALRTGMLQSRWSGAFVGAGIWLVGNELLLPALGTIEREEHNLAMQANA